ncbi:MAG: N-acetyltransferase, partial [Cytophagia bacterium]
MQLRILQLKEDKKDKLFDSKNAQELLDIYEGYYTQFGFDLPWVAYLIIKQNQVVGTCSFITKPKDGKVEIAYWTFKDFEMQGVASFGCKELVKIAKNADPAIIITAKTAPEYNPSTKILEKNGFIF